MYATCLKAVAVSALLLLASCGTAPAPSDAAKSDAATSTSAADPVSGRTAFFEIYKSARSWAPDLVPLTLESKVIPGMKNDAGKAALWSAAFASPSRHEARVFTYAVAAHAPDIYKGVTVGHSLPWGGPTHDVMPFQSSDFSTDSDAAYKTALPQASAWASKHPTQEVSFTLGNTARFSGPVWYVLWGDKKSGYGVFVSAQTGALVKEKTTAKK